MRKILLVLLCAFTKLHAQGISEAEHIGKLMHCLETKDDEAYHNLFPPGDSIAQWVLRSTDRNTDTFQQMQMLLMSQVAMMNFDSAARAEHENDFEQIMMKGDYFDVHWDHILFVRYELEKLPKPKSLINRKVSSTRFLGYLFFRDMLTRKTYAITIYDMMQVNGEWYGGSFINMYEAATKEEYETAMLEEKKRLEHGGTLATDSTGKTASKESDAPPAFKQILERKFYKGTFDNEIEVLLYVRYIKGGCPEVVCSYEALFKFGDQDEYVKMEVTKQADGRWLFAEEEGGMELVLKDKTYTGTWASDSDNTGYEVKLVESPASNKRLKYYDEMLNKGKF